MTFISLVIRLSRKPTPTLDSILQEIKTKVEKVGAYNNMKAILGLALLSTAAMALETPVSQIQTLTTSVEEESDSIASTPKVQKVTTEKADDCIYHQAAWLGVLGDPIEGAMQAQLDLESGLVLKYIAPNSPAAKAGLQKFDIIRSVNSQPIKDQASLKKAIQSLESHTPAMLSVYSKGQEREVKVKLCERPKRKQVVAGDPRSQPSIDRLKNMMKASGERASADSISDLGGRIKQVLQGITADLNIEATSSVQLRDEQGSVEIHTINNEKNVTVRDAQDQIKFEGPWNGAEDYAEAPEGIKKRIDGIGLNMPKINEYVQDLSNK